MGLGVQPYYLDYGGQVAYGGGGTDAGMSAPESDTSSLWGSAASSMSSTMSNSLWTAAAMYNEDRDQERQEQEARRQFDLNFYENMRRYGLNYALQEWAQRNAITLANARSMYEQQTGKANLADNLHNSRLQRDIARKRMAWLEEDREKSERMSRAFARGLMKGFMAKPKKKSNQGVQGGLGSNTNS